MVFSFTFAKQVKLDNKHMVWIVAKIDYAVMNNLSLIENRKLNGLAGLKIKAASKAV